MKTATYLNGAEHFPFSTITKKNKSLQTDWGSGSVVYRAAPA
ncbi:protein of unknown function [Cupriavidus taiwanensis]|nr:protein of unknown function [Cupriavidus taiwanensis]